MGLVFNFHPVTVQGALLTLTARFSGMLAAFPRHFELGYCAIALITILTVMIAIGFAIRVFWVHSWPKRLRSCARQYPTNQDQSLHFLNALLGNSHNSLVVLGAESNFGDGNTLLQQCMAGPDAPVVANAVSGLQKIGRSFELSARTADGSIFCLRGSPIGHRAVIYFQERGASDLDIPFRTILDEFPAPVWLRSEELSLCWANRAFLAAVGSKTLQEARVSNATMGRTEIDLAATAQCGQSAIEARRFVVVGGQRRTLAINLIPIHGTCVAGIAIDMSEITKVQTKMQLIADAHADVLERLPLCIAIFDADQRLMTYNGNYAKLWDLSDAWLDTCPSYGEILSSLREMRKLPEQRDFAVWKRAQLQTFGETCRQTEDLWHLPGGKSVYVTTRPHLQGGIFVLLEDVTERLRLETSFNLLAQVQKATLDTLEEGIAIFEPDGRLVLHNAHFAALWRLTEIELANRPHLTEIAGICNRRVGPDEIWGIVSADVNSMEPEHHGKWTKARYGDGRIMSLSSSRLPNGATVVTFMDFTDLERFEALQREFLPDSISVSVKANRNS